MPEPRPASVLICTTDGETRRTTAANCDCSAWAAWGAGVAVVAVVVAAAGEPPPPPPQPVAMSAATATPAASGLRNAPAPHATRRPMTSVYPRGRLGSPIPNPALATPTGRGGES